MFRWYAKAHLCYAFLSDVTTSNLKEAFDRDDEAEVVEPINTSKWFQRGWTLQELLAPGSVLFYDVSWSYIGNRRDCCEAISGATHIPTKTLAEGLPAVGDRPCVAAIMLWASGRKTTRLEVRAYSLLGLFDVNMPLLYGEGRKAFTRLQEEILRYSDGQSIFAWDNAKHETVSGLLATSPDCFGTAALLRRRFISPQMLPRRQPHTITNEGISV